ncbi:MAG: hypothetical protein ACOVRM_01145, partial [Planctomycetaceae bacterium]
FVALCVFLIALDPTLEKVSGRTRGSLLSPLQIPDLHLIFICISGLLAVTAHFGQGLWNGPGF